MTAKPDPAGVDATPLRYVADYEQRDFASLLSGVIIIL